MTTAYTPILKLALPVTGELSGTWGTVVNDNITSMVEQAVAGLATINTWTTNAHTLTTADGTTAEARCAMLVAADGSGGTALTGAGDIICPAASKLYVLKNGTSYTVTLKTSGGTGVAVPSGDTAFLFCDGTNVNACVTTIVNGHISGNLTVDGNTILGNASTDTITATAQFNTDLLPSTDNARDLGSTAKSWRTLYCDTSVLVGNLSLSGNTIASTDTNGNVVIAPNGTGDVQLDADTVRVGDSNANATITTNGTGNLILNTNSGTNSGSITIQDGVDGNIIIAPNGNGQVQITNAALDLTTIEVTNINAKDGSAAMSIANSTGVVTVSSQLNVDNLNLSANTLSSTDSNGNIVIAPNGTGDVQLDADTVRVGDSAAAVTLTSNGAGALTVTTGGAADLVLNTNSGTNSGSITIGNGTNGNITVATNGTGDFYVDADTVRIGDSNANATLTTNGTGDLILNTNSGTNSGSITIEDGVNGNIIIAPNGTGQVQITNAALDLTTIEVSNINAKDGTAAITIADSTGAVGISTAVTMSATTQNIALGTSQTSGTFTVGGAAQTGTQTFDQSTKTHTLNIGAGATESAATKTINIGTGGVATSTTAIAIGSTNGTTITLNGTVNATTVNVTTLDLTNLEVTNIKAKDGTASMTLADGTGAITLSATAGTANGVLYLNGSRAVSSGSALTFDGTVLSTTTVDATNIDVTNVRALDGTAAFSIANTTGVVTIDDTKFTLQDETDNTKKALFQLSGITTATTRTYTLPNFTGTLATIGNLTQTFSGSTTFSSTFTLSGTTTNIALGTSQTSGTWTAGGAAQTGAITLDQSTKTHTLNIGTGATENTLTKTINIGTSGVSGSTTTITIGSANGTTVTVNGTVTAATFNSTTIDATNLEVTNIKAKDGTAAMSIADSTGAVTVSSAFAANGGVTIGDASGDAFTINSSAVSTPNGLNFDSNTFVIDAANNRVGIGETNPAALLDVNSGAVSAYASPAANFLRNHGAQSYQNLAGTQIYWNTSNGSGESEVVFGNLSTSFLRFIQNNAGTFTECARITSGGQFAMTNDGTNAAPAISFTNDLDTGIFRPTTNQLGFATAGVQAMTLDATGDLAIGRTSVSTIGSGYRTIDMDGLNGAGFRLRANGTSVGTLYCAGTTYAEFGAIGSAYLRFAVNGGDEKARITSGGYFKASNDGTYRSATGSYHEFRQSAGNENTLYVASTNNSTPYGVEVAFTAAAPNNTTNYFLSSSDNAATRAVIRSNGGLANYQSNNVDLSDIRTKTDISPLASYWNKIAALEIVSYKYKDQTHDDLNIGVIAQQVEQVAPEFVDADGFGETPEDGVPLKTIYNKDLTFAAIKALQEAMARIEKLEAKVASLEAK